MKAGSPAEHVVSRGSRGEGGLRLAPLSEGGEYPLPLAGREGRRRLVVRPLSLANVPEKEYAQIADRDWRIRTRK